MKQTNIWEEFNKPMARCTYCVWWWGDAPRTDKLRILAKNGKDYLVCNRHWKKRKP